VGHGVAATGSFNFAQVREVVDGVVAAMGGATVRIVELDEAAGRIELGFLESGGQRARTFSVSDLFLGKEPDLVVEVRLSGNRLTVGVIGANRSRRSGGVASGPSKLVLRIAPHVYGTAPYGDFLDRFTAELEYLFPTARLVRR
jgi:hypothetical protein